NTARHYGLRDLGAIAPGYLADIVTFADLHAPRVTRTIAGGRLVAAEGRLLVPQHNPTPPPPNRVVAPGLGEHSFAITAQGTHARVIGVVPGQIITRSLVAEVATRDGQVMAAPERDLLKIAVVERHRGSSHVGVGLV